MPSHTKKAAKRVTRVDPIKPKRPLPAFFLFMDGFKEQYKSKHHRIKSVADVSKGASEIWKAMSDEEKAPFIKMAETKKGEYKKEMEAYHRKMVEAERTRVKDEPQSDVNDEEGERNSSEEED